MKIYLKSVVIKYLIPVIFVSAAIFRLYGLNWDQNQHLHPDERFLTMVVQALKWPPGFLEYVNSEVSTLNPNNAGYSFFVYGTFPLILIKFLAGFIQINQFDYHNITLVGRLFSAIFDLGTLLVIFLIGKKIFDKKTALIAGFIYAFSVLCIQLSHFFTVDTFLSFFLLLSFYFLLKYSDCKKPFVFCLMAGVSFGLALSCKISALLFLPVVVLLFLFFSNRHKKPGFAFLYLTAFFVFSYLSFRLADPHVFRGENIFIPKINPHFVQNLKDLKSFDDPDGFFPPAVQWINTKPILFPFKNLFLWGLGPLSGVIAIISILYHGYSLTKKIPKIFTKHKLKLFDHVSAEDKVLFLALFWIIFLFIYQGVQFTKTMRYFHPIFPFLAVVSGVFLRKCFTVLEKKISNKTISGSLVLFFIFSILIWPLSFISIYSRPHSRVIASEWIYDNIPPGSILSCEHWDDCLPLSVSGKSHQIYVTETLELYNPDTQQKWEKIGKQMKNIDYLIMSSNRLWGSIPKVPERYPVSSRFYNDLFSGNLPFEKVAEITSYPTVPILRIPIRDDNADEAFTVYDHPRVLIYKKNESADLRDFLRQHFPDL